MFTKQLALMRLRSRLKLDVVSWGWLSQGWNKGLTRSSYSTIFDGTCQDRSYGTSGVRDDWNSEFGMRKLEKGKAHGAR